MKDGLAESSEEFFESIVDNLLREVDYSFPGFVPSTETFAFFNFIQLVNGGKTENSNPLVHYKMIDNIFTSKNRKHAILSHRGIAKSTLMGVYLPLYVATTGNFPGFGSVNYMIYVADSMENNVRTTMNTIRDVYESSDFLKDKFEIAKFTDTRFTLVRHQVLGESKSVSERRLYMSGYGSSTGVRGTRKGQDRPQVALVDDLIKSNADARSEAILRSIRDTVFSDIKAAMHPTHQRIIWTGTPFNQNDPLYMAIESGAWEPSVYPVCEEISSNITEKDFSGSWPDRFTYESVMENYTDSVADGSVEEFMQEMMLRISSEENRLIDEGKLIWFNKKDVLENRSAYNWYITTDLATRKEKTSDFAVILIWAINSKGDHLLVDGQAKRGEPNDHIEALFDYCQKYNPLSVGIEITGQQVTFVDMLRNKMIQENRYFNIHEQKPGKPGITGSGRTSKYEKFLGVLHLFSNNKIWVPRDMKKSFLIQEFLNELRGVSTTNTGKRIGSAKHDDILDCISQVQYMNIVSPSEEKEFRPNKETGVYELVDLEEDEFFGGSSYIF
ncbi:MAG: hypothetical protein DRQ78_11315 [Epsilonproteobacteria bacterium]|nr:MAG: hypothetical protein DRQ78_11315 [Campylobacterota bacterium]